MNFMIDDTNILRVIRNISEESLAEIALQLAEHHPEIFVQFYNGNYNTVKIQLPSWNDPIYIKPAQMEKIKSYGEGYKVTCIKWLREEFGIGLKEAKDLSEELVHLGYLKHKNWVPGYTSDFIERQQEEFRQPGISLGDILKEQLNKY
jgi:hypothetical protein